MVLAPYKEIHSETESAKPEALQGYGREIWRRIRRHYTRYYPVNPRASDLNIFHCRNISLVSMMNFPASNPSINSKQAIDERLPLADRKNTIWYDANWVKLVQYFPRMFSEGWEHVLTELRQLVQDHPPRRPPEKEKRSQLHDSWLQQLPPGTPSGVIRLTIHHQSQHCHDRPLASHDLLSGTGIHTAASINFRRSPAIIDIADKISVLLAAVDPDTWKEYREVYVKMASYRMYSYLRDWDPSNIQCFVGHYILVNVLTTIHRDLKDPKEGWVAMLVLGNFAGGNLCLPEMNVALPYQPGDVVFIRSWALQHFIRRYQGIERYVIVFSTPATLFNWEPPKDEVVG